MQLITGNTPFRDVPGPHLGHAITALKKRPEFSLAVPRAYRELAEACWADDPDKRPTFTEVFQRLTAMRAELPGPPDPMPVVQPPPKRKKVPRPGSQQDASLGSDKGSSLSNSNGLVIGNGTHGSYRDSRGGLTAGGSGVGAIVIGVGAHASMHSCLMRSRLAGVPEGNESAEETTTASATTVPETVGTQSSGGAVTVAAPTASSSQ